MLISLKRPKLKRKAAICVVNITYISFSGQEHFQSFHQLWKCLIAHSTKYMWYSLQKSNILYNIIHIKVKYIIGLTSVVPQPGWFPQLGQTHKWAKPTNGPKISIKSHNGVDASICSSASPFLSPGQCPESLSRKMALVYGYLVKKQ